MHKQLHSENCLGINCVIAIVAGTEEFQKMCNSTLANHYTHKLYTKVCRRVVNSAAAMFKALRTAAHAGRNLVSQCSAIGVSVAASPSCSAIRFCNENFPATQ